MMDLTTITKSFVDTAIWADATEGTRPRINRKEFNKVSSFISAFTRAHSEICAEVGRLYKVFELAPAEMFGHDFYLTCAGHGAGFWDRPILKDKGGEISEIIQTGWRVEFYQYRGWVYFNLYKPRAEK